MGPPGPARSSAGEVPSPWSRLWGGLQGRLGAALGGLGAG